MFKEFLRKFFSLFLCFKTLIIQKYDQNKFTLAQSCSNIKLPLTFGFSSGETEIKFID